MKTRAKCSWRVFALINAVLLLGLALSSCSTMEVDSSPSDRFADKGYRSFSWKTELPTGVSGSMDSLYRLSSTVRDVVSAELQKKGYRYDESGGEFLISHEFHAGLTAGAPSVTPDFGPSSAVINRGTDPALADNSYALSGPKEVASLTLHFEDGGNLAPVWTATLSQVVENRNQPDLDKVRRKLKPGIAKAFRRLPDAPTA